jgi:hypothetical protein
MQLMRPLDRSGVCLRSRRLASMYVADFYISAISIWTLTTPGVTWERDKTCKASSVNVESRMTRSSLLHESDLHKSIPRNMLATAASNGPCRADYQRSILNRMEYTKSIPKGVPVQL